MGKGRVNFGGKSKEQECSSSVEAVSVVGTIIIPLLILLTF